MGWCNQWARDFFKSGKFIAVTVTFQSRVNSRFHCRSTRPAAAIVPRVERSTSAQTPDQIAAKIDGAGRATAGVHVNAGGGSLATCEVSRCDDGADVAATSRRPIVATSSAAQSDCEAVGFNASLDTTWGAPRSGGAGTRSSTERDVFESSSEAAHSSSSFGAVAIMVFAVFDSRASSGNPIAAAGHCAPPGSDELAASSLKDRASSLGGSE